MKDYSVFFVENYTKDQAFIVFIKINLGFAKYLL